MGSILCRILWPQGLQSSSTITLTGQNRTDLLAAFPREDGVLLKQDLENDDVEEHVDPCKDLDDWTEEFESFCFVFGVPPLKRELRKLARRAPGEIGCFTFFKSWYIFEALDLVLRNPFSCFGFGFGISVVVLMGFGRERNSDSDEENLPAVQLDSDELELEFVKSRTFDPTFFFFISIHFSTRRNFRASSASSVLAAAMLCFVIVVSL